MLIELGWGSLSNVQQMVRAFLLTLSHTHTRVYAHISTRKHTYAHTLGGSVVLPWPNESTLKALEAIMKQ